MEPAGFSSLRLFFISPFASSRMYYTMNRWRSLLSDGVFSGWWFYKQFLNSRKTIE